MYDKNDRSTDPFPHTHLWELYEEKERKTGKVRQVEMCKFCHIVREANKKK